MPSTHHLVSLCKVLVEDMLGQVGAQIVLVLLQVGRLSVKELTKATKYPHSAVKRALVSLVHMRLVLFWEDPNQWGPTYYRADTTNIYHLLWTGKIMAQLKEEVQKDELDPILLNFITNGHFSIEDYVEKNPEAREKLEQLLRTGYLVPLHDFEFWPEEDIKQQSTTKHLRDVNKDPTTLSLTDNAKKQMVDAAVKRDLNGMEASRQAGAKGLVTAAPADEKLVVTVNYERFLLTERRKELVRLVDDRIGSVTAQVYDAVLECSEHGRSLFQRDKERVPMPGNTVNSSEVLLKLQARKDPVNLESAFIADTQNDEVKAEPDAPVRGHKRMKSKIGSISVTPVAALTPLELVNQHLRLLERAGFAFLRRVGDLHGGEWFVPMSDLIADLRRHTFDEIVSELLGSSAARILRVVREYSKIDEKALSQTSLLQSNDLRVYTNNLEYFGFIDLQEVPRSNDRAPGRNIYLWFHRPKWAYARLVEQIYGAMVKTYDDIFALRTKHRTLLAKLTRVDVAGHEDELLTAQEKVELAEYTSQEQQLWVKQQKLDRHVQIFCYY